MSKLQLATFATGWFWGPEASFGCAEGVVKTKVGYTGGTLKNPSYHNMGDNTESIFIQWDPSKTTYEKLLKIFWSIHSPTHKSSVQYKSAIWFHNKEQQELALKTLEEEGNRRKAKIYTVIEPAGLFTDAEDYHQKWELRKHDDILKCLNLKTNEQLIQSSIAARLNGYVSGNGDLNQLMKEIDSFGLPSSIRDFVIDIASKGGGGSFCRI